MAVFEKFGGETDINSRAKSIRKVVFIIRQYPAEIGTTPILDRAKIVDFHKYHFQNPFLTGLVTKLV